MTKTVACRGCGKPTKVGDRDRTTEYFCSAFCVPKCEFPGCDTDARGMGKRCWRHRNQ